jgi:hypothetical protein
VAIIGVQTVVFAFGILQGHARLTMHATIRKSFVASHHGSSQGQKLKAEDPDREDSYGEAEVSSCISVLQLALGFMPPQMALVPAVRLPSDPYEYSLTFGPHI